jgi:hypothetical protein
VTTRGDPNFERCNLIFCYFFGGGVWNDRTCFDAAEKLTDWGDAATAF